MADPTPAPGGDLGELLRRFADLARRVGDLESPSGTQRYQSVAKLSALIDDIQAQLDAYNASRYTNAQIDSRIASPPSSVSVSGDVTASSALRGQNLYASQAPGFNITGTRVAAWLEVATGRLGTASSSRRYKQDELPAEIDADAVLSIEPKQFRYIEQVEQVGDEAAVEVGFIAEDLEDAGLTQWVVYREIDDEVVADGVEYSTWVVALHAAARALSARSQEQQQQIDAQQDQIDALTARLDALDGGTS